jgi:uncharacterized protein HemY
MTDAVAKPAELVGQGNEALRNAEWEAARNLFARALEQEVTPEALEGLAKAAFFLDEAELALESRERAYTGYREAGRAVDGARLFHPYLHPDAMRS